MGVTEYAATQLELLSLISWLMKDLGWVLLLPALGWSAAVGAICLEFHGTVSGWKADSGAVRVHGVAIFLWIIGNSIWMTSEFLFDATSSIDKKTQHSVFPWFSGPLAGKEERAYWAGVHCARALFGIAICLLVGFVLTSAWNMRHNASNPPEGCGNPQDETDASVEPADELVCRFITPKVYMMVFIGPWILKDVFWTLELLAPALLCSVVVLILTVDAYRRFFSPSSLVETFWALANGIWIVAELALPGPTLGLRLCAATMLVAGLGLAVGKLAQVHMQQSRNSNLDASETTPLTSSTGPSMVSSSATD
mmetsp:Transcript_84002/g.166831  ORF Transcript_84002/g.166831 Transcript_84002/m.166831 type:complete len:310 (-) Transcript_84002:118-1047(-)